MTDVQLMTDAQLLDFIVHHLAVGVAEGFTTEAQIPELLRSLGGGTVSTPVEPVDQAPEDAPDDPT